MSPRDVDDRHNLFPGNHQRTAHLAWRHRYTAILLTISLTKPSGNLRSKTLTLVNGV